MKRLALIVLLVSFSQSGCALCCGTYDYAYAGHGGKWQRGDLFEGRVGSPFSDPSLVAGPVEVIDGGSFDDGVYENNGANDDEVELIEPRQR